MDDGWGARMSRRCNARVGLLGNPSDGYFGKTLSFTLGSFYAEVLTFENGFYTQFRNRICSSALS